MNKRMLPKWLSFLSILSICAVAACGFDFSQLLDGVGSPTASAEFRDIVAGHPTGAPLEDAQVEQLVTRLESLLNGPDAEPLAESEATRYMRGLRWALGRGQVTQEQIATVSAYLDDWKSEHPDAAEMIDREKGLLTLTPGAVAQNIVGTDTEGVEFELQDYRGNIVVLVFSGEWCGPCRGEYPYQHELMETYKDDPVVLLGVNSDRDIETIKKAKASGDAPPYRVWWDGSTRGPISKAWDVWAWPSTFILDANGVVRFVGKRKDRMIEAVGELLEEQREVVQTESGSVSIDRNSESAGDSLTAVESARRDLMDLLAANMPFDLDALASGSIDMDLPKHPPESLLPGKVAPNIVGKDTDGVEFELEDYRGNIVVLIFSGEWCGPCREEYPYQRQMLERYKGTNVVLLGVNSDPKLETIQKAKEREGLYYRTWWDGSAFGPINQAWVSSWPSIFILDEEGVIIHDDKRGEEIIKAVDELLETRRPEIEREASRPKGGQVALHAVDHPRERLLGPTDGDHPAPW